MHKIAIVVAHSKNRVIGCQGEIPWHYPNDLRNFRELTNNHVVIMGRKTYESIPEKYRPLPNRHTVILTKNPTYHVDHTDVSVCDSVEKALMVANMRSRKDTIFVAGGAEVYNLFMPMAKIIYSTIIQQQVDGDVFFPDLNYDSSWCFNWGDSYYRNLTFRSSSDNFEYVTLNRWRD